MVESSISGDTFLKSASLFLVVAVLAFLVRSIYTVEPEIHDSRKKWIVAADLVETHDPTLIVSWDHHSSRWGVVLPAAIAIQVNGKNLISYLVLVLGLFAIVFAMLVTFSTRETGVGLLFFSAVLLFYEPMFFRASSQMQPFVFGVLYITVSLWLICRYLAGSSALLLGLSALFAFCAYGSKEPYLFFIPGLLLLLTWKSGYRSSIVFCLWLGGFLVFETLIFNMLSGELVLGRIEFLKSGKHVAKMTGAAYAASSARLLAEYYNSLPPIQKLVEFLFGRWLRLPASNQILVITACGYLAYLGWSRRFLKLGNFSLGIIFLALSYSILLSITPLSIRPLLPLQPLLEKYLTPVMPFFMYIVILCIGQLVSSLDAVNRRRSIIGLNSLAALFLVYAMVLESPLSYQIAGRDYPVKEAMFWKYKDLNYALEEGAVVCAKRSKHLRKTKVLFNLYMNEDNIMEQIRTGKVDGLPVLHLKGVDPKAATVFIPFGDYDARVTHEECRSRLDAG